MQKFQKTNTFTIGFNESEHDESKSASEIAKILKTNHTSIICSNKEAIDVLIQDEEIKKVLAGLPPVPPERPPPYTLEESQILRHLTLT